VKLHTLVAVLGYSRMVAVRFAPDTTRLTTLRLLLGCLDDLDGAPGEVLTDRDPAFVVGSTPSGHAVFAPEWIDLAAKVSSGQDTLSSSHEHTPRMSGGWVRSSAASSWRPSSEWAELFKEPSCPRA
jgi:transposase